VERLQEQLRWVNKDKTRAVEVCAAAVDAENRRSGEVRALERRVAELELQRRELAQAKEDASAQVGENGLKDERSKDAFAGYYNLALKRIAELERQAQAAEAARAKEDAAGSGFAQVGENGLIDKRRREDDLAGCCNLVLVHAKDLERQLEDSCARHNMLVSKSLMQTGDLEKAGDRESGGGGGGGVVSAAGAGDADSTCILTQAGESQSSACVLLSSD